MNIRGAQYWPARAYTNYQIWWQYNPQEIERDLSFANRLGLNAVRVFLSYEYWQEEATDDRTTNAHISAFEHFLTQANNRSITVLPVFFESIGEEPTPENLQNQDINTAWATKSPSLQNVIQPGNWDGYFASPRHFVTRMTNFLQGDNRVLAIEIMNEPAGPTEAPKRHQFATEMLRAVRATDPDRLLSMGARSPEDNLHYTNPRLDVFQYHHNLPPTEEAFRQTAQNARQLANEYGVPIWNTEWQRIRAEPPDRFLPHYQNLAPVVNDLIDRGILDGAFLWSLMLKPAYIMTVREQGRVNGVFHETGDVFKKADADAIAGRDTGLSERREYTEEMEQSRFPFPEPAPDERMARGRALMTEYEKESLAGNHGDQHKDEAVSRVRARIHEELPEEVALMAEHAPNLLSDLREVVCSDE